MTNEDFIIEKRMAKFDLIWNRLINELPKSSQKSLEKNGCAFNCKLVAHKEYYVVCRRVDVKDSATAYMNRSNLQSIFTDNKSFLTEIREYQAKAQERIDNALEFTQSDINSLRARLSKQYRRLLDEKRYAEILIKIGGGSIKFENKIDRLTLYGINAFIKENRAKRKFSYIYFEFKEFGIEKISQIIWRKYGVQDILIEPKVSQFVGYCEKNKIVDIYDLLLMPFYSKRLVAEFGAECLQAVINSIKTFIDLQIFEYTNISFDDLC